ncbi:MAG: hypothetical protein EBQ96_07840 [Proteobacteria bacterium]|nr:hypothetical protein [Pseudomonadota bacterium]
MRTGIERVVDNIFGGPQEWLRDKNLHLSPLFKAAVSYKVFTTAFDEEVRIKSLLRRQDIRLPKKPDIPEFELYTHDDTAKALGAFKDKATVTLLIDHSGSQRGGAGTANLILAGAVAQELSDFGIVTEVLGYTTKAWKGGQAREEWLKAGRPSNPGRLNDLRHIIYKSRYDGDNEYQTLMNKCISLSISGRAPEAPPETHAFERILRENIDGEAIAWAHRRLLSRPNDTRLIVVLSDESPVDDSTVSVNFSNILHDHADTVIKIIQQHSPIGIMSAVQDDQISRNNRLLPYETRHIVPDFTPQAPTMITCAVAELLEGIADKLHDTKRRANNRMHYSKHRRLVKA